MHNLLTAKEILITRSPAIPSPLVGEGGVRGVLMISLSHPHPASPLGGGGVSNKASRHIKNPARAYFLIDNGYDNSYHY
jgi:hypothetical protein